MYDSYPITTLENDRAVYATSWGGYYDPVQRTSPLSFHHMYAYIRAIGIQ